MVLNRKRLTVSVCEGYVDGVCSQYKKSVTNVQDEARTKRTYSKTTRDRRTRAPTGPWVFAQRGRSTTRQASFWQQSGARLHEACTIGTSNEDFTTI